MTKRKAQQARARLADRGEAAREIGEAVVELRRSMGPAAAQRDGVMGEIASAIRRDLGDLAAEALKITRL
jgi:hypothetical protein